MTSPRPYGQAVRTPDLPATAAQSQIRLLFLLCSLAGATWVALVGGPAVDGVVLAKMAVAALAVFLALAYLEPRLPDPGLAVVCVLAALAAAGFLGSWARPGRVLALVALVVLTSASLRGLRLAWSASARRSLMLVAGLSLPLGLAAAAGCMGAYGGFSYIDFFVDHKLPHAQVAKDSLLHASIAAMLTEHTALSTSGLHGVSHILNNYAFSHAAYAGLARLLGISVLESYGHATFLLFVPLLFHGLLAATEVLSASRLWIHLPLRVLFLLAAFLGFIGYESFDRLSQLHYYFVIESFVLGLVLMLALLRGLLAPQPRVAWAIVVFMCVGLTKAPVAVAAAPLLVVLALSRLRGAVAASSALLACAAAAAVALVATPQGVSAILTSNPFEFYGLGYCGGALALCMAVHYFFVLLAVLLLVVYARGAPQLASRCRPLGVATVLAALAGLLAQATMRGTFSLTFSNASMFLALPLVLTLPVALLPGHSVRWTLSPAWLVFGWGMLGMAFYGPGTTARMVDLLAGQAAWAGSASPSTGYIAQLRRIRSDPQTRGALVYVAKQERDFWGEYRDCATAPLLIPAVSEHPALFGLPDAGCEAAYFGYQVYPRRLFELGSAPRLKTTDLCAETRSLGFDAFVDVRRFSYSRTSCVDPTAPEPSGGTQEDQASVPQSLGLWQLVGYAASRGIAGGGPAELRLLWLPRPTTRPRPSGRFRATGGGLWELEVSPAVNLLSGADFEGGTGGFPEDSYAADSSTRALAEEERSGRVSRVARLQGSATQRKTSLVTRTIPVRPGHYYLHAGWVRSLAGNAVLGVLWQPSGRQQALVDGLTTPEWQHAGALLRAPGDATGVQVRLINYDSTGAAEFDDILLVDVGDLAHLRP